MPVLYECFEPVEIPVIHAPAPGRNTEQEDALAALRLVLDSDSLQTHDLGFGSYTTRDFDIFEKQSVQALPTAGRILVSANTMLYLPNEEGSLGDITIQSSLGTHGLPGVVIGQDTDVLVIAQRLQANMRHAATAVLALCDLEQAPLHDLTVSYGAY